MITKSDVKVWFIKRDRDNSHGTKTITQWEWHNFFKVPNKYHILRFNRNQHAALVIYVPSPTAVYFQLYKTVFFNFLIFSWVLSFLFSFPGEKLKKI